MAERVPPDTTTTINTDPNADDHVPVLPNTNPDPNFRSGTYVVQVPKDQIYRVPPPENALIVERHRKPEQKKRAPCCSCFLRCFIIIVIVVLVLGLIAGISAILLKPKDPNFSLERILVKNQTSHHKHPRYDITLKVENPNKISGILYKQDGVSSLSLRQQKIATGSYPTFYQEHGNSTNIGIVLKGSNILLPKEIDKSMKSQKKKLHVSMSLKITVPVNMKTGIFSAGNIKIVVTCDFMVDTLAKGSRILSQECQTKH